VEEKEEEEEAPERGGGRRGGGTGTRHNEGYGISRSRLGGRGGRGGERGGEARTTSLHRNGRIESPPAF